MYTKRAGDKLANAAQAATDTTQKATDTAQAAIKEASTTTRTAAKGNRGCSKTGRQPAGSTSLWLGALASLSVSLLGLLGLLFWWARQRPS